MPGIRVIAGAAKGRKLKMVPGAKTRPIGDRVKQALFNILGPDVVGARFLDLFAGTGSVGIEAISRGASSSTFIELDRKAIRTIEENLAICDFTARALVRQGDAFAYLASQVTEPFDIVYIAPPQYLGMWAKALEALERNIAWVNPDGLVIVQLDPSEYEPQALEKLSLFDERKYGNTKFLFFENPGT